MSTVDLARQAYHCFERAQRPAVTDTGQATGEKFWRIREGSPEWVTDLVREVFHDNGHTLPDDGRYELAMDTLSALVEDHDRDDWPPIEPDVYTSDLMSWLANDPDARDLVNEQLQDGDWKDLDALVGAAQSCQRERMREECYAWLERHEDEDETEED